MRIIKCRVGYVQQAGMPYWALTVKAIDWYYGLGEYNYTVTGNRISHAAKITRGSMIERSDKFDNSIFIFSLHTPPLTTHFFLMLTNKTAD